MTYIKAIFFDLDETLIENRMSVTDVFGRMFFDFSDKLGTSNKSVFFGELRERAQTLWAGMFHVSESPEQQLVTCFEHCILATGAVSPEMAPRMAKDMLDHFLFLSAGNVQFQDDAEAVLSKLQEKGYITGIITNGIEQIQLGKVHKLGLNEKVHHVTVSAQARAHKPLNPVFDLALTRAGARPEECWMIGDHPTNDVAGGMRAGMAGVYYNPKFHSLETAFAELTERPNYTINSLSELNDLL